MVAKLDTHFYALQNLLANVNTISTDESFGLKSTGNLSFDSAGQKEKWFQDKNNAWYYMLQDGSVYRWSGQAKKATGTLFRRYEAVDYLNVDRVFNAFDNVMADWLAVLD